MVPKPRNVNFERSIHASVGDVYHAFTNSTWLRGWLCDSAQTEARPGGRIYLWWESGYYTSGEFTNLIPNQMVAFTWHGRGDPGDTEVYVTLHEKDAAHTQLRLKQTKVKSRGGWIQFREEIQHGWETGLENLVSVLETGKDLRVLRKPILGVSMGDFGPEKASQLGVPVAEGIRLEDVVPGMGAALAGLQKNDVLVSIAGKPILEASELGNALRGKQAGDKIEVVYYRGSKVNVVTMTLSTRAMPELPATRAELVTSVRLEYERAYQALARCFDHISEAEAGYAPGPGAWSAKQVLAHLIHGERGLHEWISDLVSSQERVPDAIADNLQARVAATVAAYPRTGDLLVELQRHQDETLHLITNLPDGFEASKGHFWRMGLTVLKTASHIGSHLIQLQAAIEAGRGNR